MCQILLAVLDVEALRWCCGEFAAHEVVDVCCAARLEVRSGDRGGISLAIVAEEY